MKKITSLILLIVVLCLKVNAQTKDSLTTEVATEKKIFIKTNIWPFFLIFREARIRLAAEYFIKAHSSLQFGVGYSFAKEAGIFKGTNFYWLPEYKYYFRKSNSGFYTSLGIYSNYDLYKGKSVWYSQGEYEEGDKDITIKQFHIGPMAALGCQFYVDNITFDLLFGLIYSKNVYYKTNDNNDYDKIEGVKYFPAVRIGYSF